jgi:hypothetical protein
MEGKCRLEALESGIVPRFALEAVETRGQAYAALRTLGVLNRAGEARRLLNDYRLLRQTQAGLSAALGMTPLARVQLKATSTRAALDLAAAMAAPEDADVVADDGKPRSKGSRPISIWHPSGPRFAAVSRKFGHVSRPDRCFSRSDYTQTLGRHLRPIVLLLLYRLRGRFNRLRLGP